MEEAPSAGIEKMTIALDLNLELFFPLEIMFEILSRLPVASLLKCQCVCKRWNEIIQHPKFIEMHMLRSSEASIVYSSETYIVFDNSYGLLVERSRISGKYRVRNSATKHILALPDPEEKPIYMIIVSIPSTNSYKLVYIYESEGEIGKVGFKILSFEGDDLSWRALENSYFRELDRRQRLSVQCLGGFLYFIKLYEDGSCDSQIHCLDAQTEIFTSPIGVPRSFFNNWKNVELGFWNDEKLAAMSIVEEDLHVWVLEDPIKRKWAEKMIILPLTFLKENPDMKEKLVPYWASHEEILFSNNSVNDIAYYIRSKRLWESQYSAPPGKKIMSIGCRTLVKLNGMQPEKLKKVQPEKKQQSVEVELEVGGSSAKCVCPQMEWIIFQSFL